MDHKFFRGSSRVDNDNRFASFSAKKMAPNDNCCSQKNDVIIAIIVILRKNKFY
jgi:hypothetical protein